MRQSSRFIIAPELCTGCALCANVCPKDTIQMVLNNEGFLAPLVDTTACINCGLCVKSCPAQPNALNQKGSSDSFDSITAFGGWISDKRIHKTSSSGGIFSALAAHIFSDGGCIFGVIWQDKNTAVFSKAENMQELAPMRGSKYVQAIPNYVYREVKSELEKGRHVLFVGTSCQVYALQKYLHKSYERLLTVDIICHGVPSHHLISSYTGYLEKTHKKELSHLNFRCKDDTWLKYKVQYIFKNNETEAEYSSHNLFMNLFIGGKVLNKCCYTCKHVGMRRGDITLGDFWGIQNQNTNWPIEDGITGIIAGTNKGQNVLKELANNGTIELHTRPFRILYNGQPHNFDIRKRMKLPPDRAAVLSALRSRAIEIVHNDYYNYLRLCGLRVHRNSIFAKLTKIPRKIVALFQKLSPFSKSL